MKTKPAAKRYTDAQVTAMLKSASVWADALRAAAKERGCTLPTVAEMSRVIAWLRESVG